MRGLLFNSRWHVLPMSCVAIHPLLREATSVESVEELFQQHSRRHGDCHH